VQGQEVTHEISLNPDVLGRPPEETMGTLVHEMVHQWQADHGTPPRRCYHDREWADKMIEVGLIPSDTGEPGGKQTGQRMSHYIDPDGKFIKALGAMPTEYLLPWLSHADERPRKPPTAKKVKLRCPCCDTPIWVEAGDTLPSVSCNACCEDFLTRQAYRERKKEEEDD
jgi:hypothetical protein